MSGKRHIVNSALTNYVADFSDAIPRMRAMLDDMEQAARHLSECFALDRRWYDEHPDTPSPYEADIDNYSGVIDTLREGIARTLDELTVT